MVLPWLLVGAAAALEGHRRNCPESNSERQVKQLKQTETKLRKQQKELSDQLQEAADVLMREKEEHEVDKLRLNDMERIKEEIEERMNQLTSLTDDLVRENAQLKIDNALLEDQTRRIKEENEELKTRAVALEDKVKLLTDSSEEACRVAALLEELKAEVQETLTLFTKGEVAAIEFKERMENMGIKLVDVSVEQLAALQSNGPAREVLGNTVTEQFDSQMGLVLEDRGRLEHLMNIAQTLRVTSSRSDVSSSSTSAPFDAPSIKSSSDLSSSTNSAAHGASEVPLRSGIFRALGFSTGWNEKSDKDCAPASLLTTTSSIPSAADTSVPAVGISDGLEERLESLKLDPSSNEASKEEVSVSRVEPVPKVPAKPKGLFSMRFKGLPDKKPRSNGVSISAGAIESDAADFVGNQLISK